eukprot:gb/GECG01002050.1/.p1 GENE.gb/GECG01002050.1/~~gb/GECG01002050.1/.p1  ORF type:complete len:295 (+),score=33.16 gb/GECG01002050.1/:1-885(+)
MISDTTLHKAAGSQQPLNRATHFRLQSKGIKDVSALGKCTNAKAVFLYENDIEELDEAFARLKRLNILDLSHNLLREINHLNCENLTKLYLDHNRLTKVSHLSGCVNLVELSVSNQHTHDPLEFEEESLQAISGSLKRLIASGNRMRTIEDFRCLVNLQYLDVSDNHVEDEVQMLSPLPSLMSLEWVDTRNNPYHQRVSRSWEKVVAYTPMSAATVDDKTVSSEQRVFMRRLLHPSLRRSNSNEKNARKSGEPLPGVSAVGIRRGYRTNDEATAAAHRWYGNMGEHAGSTSDTG